MYTMLSAGLAPELALAKSGISNDPVTDVALSKKYLNLVWGDPDAPIEKTVEGAVMADSEGAFTPNENHGTGGRPQNNNTHPMTTNTEGQDRNQSGVHWVNGYWKSN